MKTEFSSDWKSWIKTNVTAGRDQDGIFKILLDEGYAFEAIQKEMGYTPTKPIADLKNPFDVAAEEATQLNDFQGNNGMPILKSDIFIPNAVSEKSDKIDLRIVDNFLTASECQDIISRIKPKLRPSEVSNFEVNSDIRTSRTCDLARLNDDFIQNIDNRICQLIGINSAYSEMIQGQYYEVGQEFKSHTDFFDPHEFDTHCTTHGQRTYTVMIYLNDVEKGGETCFNRIRKTIKPATGKVVIWNNLKPDGTTNIDSLHQAKPVEKGYKAIITKWFRTTCPDAAKSKMFIKTPNERVPNFTVSGISKIEMPKHIFEKVTQYYNDNRDKQVDEHVQGDFIVGGSETAKMRATSSSIVELTPELRQEVHDALKPLLEEWCGEHLEPTFVYGIRIYHNGAVLKMHRDRIDTHIISAIINVDQDTNKDWPLVIEDNYYRTHHLMIKPGEVLLYEGARLRHGRPIMFEGKSFANMFCHFKPVDYVAPI